MYEGQIFPMDLQDKRKATGLTQESMAAILGVTRVHVARVETYARPISFSIGLECAKLFGSLKVQCGGEVYELTPTKSGDNPGPGASAGIPADDLEPTDLISRTGVESAQLAEKARQLGDHIVALRRNTLEGRTFRVGVLKEALGLFRWLAAYKETARRAHPDDYAQAAGAVDTEFAAEFGRAEELVAA